MSPAWWTEAEILRNEGLGVCEIARHIGVTSSAVSKALRPEARRGYNQRDIATRDRERHREGDRAWRRKEAARGRCVGCGELMGVSYLHNGGAMTFTCMPCIQGRAHARALEIVKWWAGGESLLVIAGRLGWSRGHLANEMSRLRSRGYDLPFRYRTHKGVARERVAA